MGKDALECLFILEPFKIDAVAGLRTFRYIAQLDSACILAVFRRGSQDHSVRFDAADNLHI